MLPRPAPNPEAADLPLESLEWMPVYVAYVGIGLLLLTAALAIHSRLTPAREFPALRNGNRAAAASLSGAMIGLALPIGAALQRAEALADLLVWSLAAIFLQLLIVLALRRITPVFDRAVSAGELASGVFLGALSIAVGLLNAAAMR